MAVSSGLVVVGAAGGTLAGNDSVTTRGSPIHHFVRAENDSEHEPESPIPDLRDKLVERAKGNPIDTGVVADELDGTRQLRWDEFSAVEGVVTVERAGDDTDLEVRMSGLVPRELYTLWVIVFDEPGFNDTRELGGPGEPETALEHLLGFGPLGEQDGSENVFRPTDGTARLAVTHPSGELFGGGHAVDSLLDEFEVHLAAALHLDDSTHGPLPGPDDGTGAPEHGFWAEQLGFAFGTGV